MKDVAVTKQEITVNMDKQDVEILSKIMENLLGLKILYFQECSQTVEGDHRLSA